MGRDLGGFGRDRGGSFVPLHVSDSKPASAAENSPCPRISLFSVPREHSTLLFFSDTRLLAIMCAGAVIRSMSLVVRAGFALRAAWSARAKPKTPFSGT